MNTITTREMISTASTAALVEFYNAHAPQPVKRFSDRRTAERRCLALLAEVPADAPLPASQLELTPAAEPVLDALDGEMLRSFGQISCPGCGVHLSNGVGQHGDEVNGRPIRHERFQFECLACGYEFGPAVARRAASPTGEKRPVLAASLRLDRTIRCCDTGETWKNAFRMWKEHSDWMTSAQQDRLTAQLYAAAKAGERRTVTINGRSFELVNVPGAA